jgi:cell wall assembly regulator SMI1
LSNTSSPRPLTSELLGQLDQRLHDLGAPVTTIWRPGLDDQQMDALTAEIGLTLSAEARAWWAWHDGIDRTIITPLPAIGPHWEPLSLAEAVQDTILMRALAAGISRDHPDDKRSKWLDSWIALCGTPSYDRLVCDCAVPAGAVSPALYFDPPGNPDPSRPKAPSIGEIVHLWLEALEDGTWHIDPATGHFAHLDPTELLRAKGPNIADVL